MYFGSFVIFSWQVKLQVKIYYKNDRVRKNCALTPKNNNNVRNFKSQQHAFTWEMTEKKKRKIVQLQALLKNGYRHTQGKTALNTTYP